MDLRLAPSILSADFACLADEIATIASVADLVHIDVMDGHYVPNITIGPGVVKALRPVTDIAFDTHLMICDPRTYAPRFVDAGSDSVTFHPLVDDDPEGLIDDLHQRGALVGIAVKPGEELELFEHLLPEIDLLLVMTVEPGFGGQSFMPEVLPKVERAAALRSRHGYRYAIEVDGGIGPDTVGLAVAAGADTLVAGSAVFGHDDRVAAGRAILAAARSALARRQAS
ncbi:MAG TPA: ribulose-phosphate 3-epimerase [Nitriliruptorales bacterium]